MSDEQYDTFIGIGGQRRYRCRMHWASGTRCQWDTYDLQMLHEHEAGHKTMGGAATRPPMPLLFDASGSKIEKRDANLPGEFQGYRFKS